MARMVAGYLGDKGEQKNEVVFERKDIILNVT